MAPHFRVKANILPTAYNAIHLIVVALTTIPIPSLALSLSSFPLYSLHSSQTGLPVECKRPVGPRTNTFVSLLTLCFRKQGYLGHWRGPELYLPPWARMLPRSPAPSSVRSSRSSMGTRVLSVWTGLATTTHPRPNAHGSAAAVSTQTPGFPSCETSQKAREGGCPRT